MTEILHAFVLTTLKGAWIIIQGLLVICVMVAIILGVIAAASNWPGTTFIVALLAICFAAGYFK